MSEQQPTKKAWYKRWWVWLLAVILLIIISSSGNKPEKVGTTIEQTNQEQGAKQEAPQQTVFKVGDKVKLGDYTLAVNNVSPCVSGNQFDTPKAGHKFVTADLTQENNGTIPRSYNMLDFKLQDDKDFSYMTTFSSCKDLIFGSGSLQPGEKTRGYMTFEIPVENKPAKLIFSPSWFSSDQIIINVQ